jgi:Tol biopolymer transport system component
VARIERGPDGEQLSRIWVSEPRSEPRPVSEGPRDLDPDWSPDGSVLIWSGLGPGDADVLMAVDPGAPAPPRVLTRGREASFSADGAWIVYSAPVRGSWKIWRMRPDGSGKHPLGASPRRERQPAASPDGRFIVYVSEESEGGRQQLWVRALPAAIDRPLAHDHDGLLPAW